jgi:hypothetical protein
MDAILSRNVFPSLQCSISVIFLPLNAHDLSTIDPQDRYMGIRLREIPKLAQWRSQSGAYEEGVDYPVTDDQDVTARGGLREIVQEARGPTIGFLQ